MATALLVGGGLVDGLTPLVFDATVSVTPAYSSTVTKHPVELGSTMTDHIFTNNTIITIKGIIANDTLGNKFSDSYKTNRIQTVHDLLDKIREERQLVVVSSELKIFPNCAITSMSTPRSAEVGDTLEVNITLEQIQVVQSSFVQVEILKPQANKGTKTPVSSKNPDNSPKDESKFKSIKRTYDDFFGTDVTPSGGTSLMPLSASGNYKQSVIIENQSYDIALQNNIREDAWYADIGNTGFPPALEGVKASTNGDMLQGFQHLDGVPDGYLSVVDLETGIGRVNRNQFNNDDRFNLIYLGRDDYDAVVSGLPA